MSFDPERITYFAETDFRSKKAPFGIKAKDRTKHVYVIGKTGMGKSTMLENMAVQDIKNGEGFAFVDPHGGTAEKLLEYVPPERLKDVLYFAPFDMDYPISFNVMEDVGADKRHLVANGLMSAFKKIWVDAWSARMEYILNNTILALLEYPGSTLISINRMFADKGYREEVVSNVTDTAVKAFWTQEFANYTDRFASEATPAIQNKVGQFVSNPLIRNIIGQSRSSFDLREMMDHRKIIIVNLSKGRMGEDNANLLGSMLITKIYLAAMSRADMSAESLERLPNFYLYVDEFQSFANESFANILSEARKYKLNLTLAHQYIEQMSEEVRAAVFGNVGTMISFRVGAYDAEILEKEFAPEFTAEDMVNLGFTQIYLKLMIDGVSSAPFSATTMPPLPLPRESYIRNIIEESRRQFAQPRDEVEDRIQAWHEKHFSSGGQGSGGQQGGRPGGGGGKKKKKKGGPSPEDRERALREAISSVTDDEDELPLAEQLRRRRDDKGPSDEKLRELEKTISQSSPKDNSSEAPGAKSNDENEGGVDSFVPLQDLAKNLGKSVDDKDSEPASQTEKRAPEERPKEDQALSSLRNLMESMVGSSAHTEEGKSENNFLQGKKEISPDKLKEILRGDDRK